MITTILYVLLVIAFLVAIGVIWAASVGRRRNARGGNRHEGEDLGRSGGRTEDLRLGYRYDSGSVFVHKNTVWTGVRLEPVGDMYMGADDVEALAYQATQALVNTAGDDEPVQVHFRLTHQPFNVEDWKAQLLRNSWNPSKLYRAYVDATAFFLRHTKTVRPVAYLLIQIDTLSQSVLNEFKQSANAALMGGHDEFIAPDLAARWEVQAARVLRNISTLGPIEPITREDRMWLIRKPLNGHFAPAMNDFPRTKPWGEGEFALWVDFTAENRRQYLHIHTLNENVAEADRSSDRDDLDSYTACLAIAEWPEETSTNAGQAWIRHFANEGVEVSYRMELLPPRKFREHLEKINNNLRGELKNMGAATGGGVTDSLVVDEQGRAEDAVQRARTQSKPGVLGQIMVQVSAPTLEELNARVEALIINTKNSLDDAILVRPSRYQWRMLESFLPGTGPSLVSVPYVRLTEPEQFGIGFPRAGVVIGDRPGRTASGQALGWTGNYIGESAGVPVFHSPHSGIARNAGGGVFVVGGSGGGKSSLALLMFFQASESGVQTVVLDPKVDFAQFCYYMAFGPQVNQPGFQIEAANGDLGKPGSRFTPTNPEFWAETEVIDIVASPPGVLDPWQVEDSVEAGALLADEMLTMFLGKGVRDRYDDVIVPAIDTVKQRYQWRVNNRLAEFSRQVSEQQFAAMRDKITAEVKKPSLYEVVLVVSEEAARIENLPEVPYETKREFGRAAIQLRQLLGLPYASLAFAENPQGFDKLRKRRTVFTLRGMKVPKGTLGEETWSKEERLAAAIMHVLVKYAAQMLDNKVTVNPVTGATGDIQPKMLFVDESYLVTSTKGGQELLLTTLAQGRSYGLITVLIDQLAKRLGQIESSSRETDGPSANQVQSVFAFLQRSDEDARSVAPLLTRNNSEMISQALLPLGMGGHLETGRCLYRDMDFHVALTDIDLLFTELLRASDTNPTTRAASQRHEISPDPWEWEFITNDDREAAVNEAQVLGEAAESVAPGEQADRDQVAGPQHAGQAFTGQQLTGQQFTGQQGQGSGQQGAGSPMPGQGPR